MSTTFTVTRDDIINAALRAQGYLDYTQTADATVVTNMAQALQILLKAWSARGLKVWCVQEVTVPLASGLRTFQIGPTATGTGAVVTDRPLRIDEAFIRYNISSSYPTDVTLTQLSRNEYVMLGNKFVTGTPNSYFYDPQIAGYASGSGGNGQVYIYVAADANSATQNELHLFCRKAIDDISSSTAKFNLPSEWYQAIKWGLADETSLENQIPTSVADRIKTKAGETLETVEDWDREYASVFLQPDLRAGR